MHPNLQVNFKSDIEMEGITRHCDFVLQSRDERPIYQVSFKANERDYITFRMQKDAETSQYKILAQKLPMWVFHAEVRISNVIEMANGSF